MSKENIALAPYILCAPTRVRPGSFNGGNVTVIYEKDLSNGKVVYVEAQYGIDGDVLVSKNMWADLSSKVVDARQNGAPKLTSDNVILAEDVAKIRQDAEIAIRNDAKNAEFMRVWHGSAAVFDHFDGAFMLTGEGSMVYGAGHYVTNVKETGRMYAGIAAASAQVRNSHREMLQSQIKEAKENGWTWRIPQLEEELAKKLGLDVEIHETADGLTGRRSKVKSQGLV